MRSTIKIFIIAAIIEIVGVMLCSHLVVPFRSLLVTLPWLVRFLDLNVPMLFIPVW